MSYAALWHKTDITRKVTLSCFQKYGHLLKWKDHDETILDLGCGDGSVTKEIVFPFVKDHAKRIVAIDKLDGMIKFAKQFNHNEHINFEVMDAVSQGEIAKRKNHFDHIFSLFVAHWVPDNRIFVNALHTMLKPKGQFFVTTVVNSPVHQSFYKHAAERTWWKYLPNEPVLAIYTNNPVKYFTGLVTDAGFNVEVCESEKGRHVIKEFPDFLRAGLFFYEHLHRIPLHLQEAYFQDHLKNCYEQGGFLGESNDYEYRYEILMCVASKE